MTLTSKLMPRSPLITASLALQVSAVVNTKTRLSVSVGSAVLGARMSPKPMVWL